MKKGLTLALVLALLVAGLALFKNFAAGDGALAATPDPEVRLAAALQGNRPVFIEFFADRCPACTSMKPIVAELKKQYGQQIEFILADTDATGRNLAIDYGIMYIPAYIFIDSQGEIVGGEQSGAIPQEQLEALLKELL